MTKTVIFDVEDRILYEGAQPKCGEKKLLSYLKDNHYKMALATSSTEERAINLLKQHNIEAYFDKFVFAALKGERRDRSDWRSRRALEVGKSMVGSNMLIKERTNKWHVRKLVLCFCLKRIHIPAS